MAEAASGTFGKTLRVYCLSHNHCFQNMLLTELKFQPHEIQRERSKPWVTCRRAVMVSTRENLRKYKSICLNYVFTWFFRFNQDLWSFTFPEFTISMNSALSDAPPTRKPSMSGWEAVWCHVSFRGVQWRCRTSLTYHFLAHYSRLHFPHK